MLDRYELLYEASLVDEAWRDRGEPLPPGFAQLGRPMAFDHRRILATAIGRLRGKLKYRPVVFELLPESFTLLQLQVTVEALSGRRLHKQNFRRLMENAGLVEGTGHLSTGSSGRPAELFRFRREVLRERPTPASASAAGRRTRSRDPDWRPGPASPWRAARGDDRGGVLDPPSCRLGPGGAAPRSWVPPFPVRGRGAGGDGLSPRKEKLAQGLDLSIAIIQYVLGSAGS